MKIALVSDLHLEFGHIDVPQADADVLVVAGDIHTGTFGGMNIALDWLEAAAETYENVVFVLGNHDFYGGEYFEVIDFWQDLCPLNPKLHFLHNDAVRIDGVWFVGTTLWTHGQKKLINDYNLIQFRNSMLHPIDTQRFHADAVEYLDKQLAIVENQPTVVVTHHAPIPECVVPKWNDSVLNEMFQANLNWLIEMYKPNYWLHGHMHDSIGFTYDETDIVCNPRGYAKVVTNFGYQHPLVLELQAAGT